LDYNVWTEWGGRLNQISSISPREDPEPNIQLQDLRYINDEVGNVKTITDYIVGNPQTQTLN